MTDRERDHIQKCVFVLAFVLRSCVLSMYHQFVVVDYADCSERWWGWRSINWSLDRRTVIPRSESGLRRQVAQHNRMYLV